MQPKGALMPKQEGSCVLSVSMGLLDTTITNDVSNHYVTSTRRPGGTVVMQYFKQPRNRACFEASVP